MNKIIKLGALALLATSVAAMPALAQDPVRGGNLSASVILTFKSLDPIRGDADTIDRFVFNQIYEPLLRLNSEGKFEPLLATSYEFVDEGKGIRLTLREGVSFHDGTPFNAEAVKFNIERLMAAKDISTRAGDVSHVDHVEIVNDHEVVIVLKAPTGSALAGLALEGTMMVSPAAVAKYGDDYGRNPVGTGAFKFVDWVGDERVKLARNENYWGVDESGNALPYLDTVDIRSITNYATAILELESGGIELMQGVNPQDFKRLDENADIALLPSPQVTSQMLIFNTQQQPVDNKAVRQAVSYCIDRPTLAKAIAGDFGAVYATMLPPADPYYPKDIKGYDYQPEKAKEILKNAGISDLSFELTIIQREPDTTVAQIIQQMVKACDISIKLNVLERQSWIERVVTQKDFQAGMLIGFFPRPDPHESWGRYFWNKGGNNWTNHSNEALFDAISDAQVETNTEERHRKYEAIANTVLDESYMLFLFARPALQAGRDTVHGLKQDVGGAWILSNAWVDK